jgi:serine/threonine-protein kinase
MNRTLAPQQEQPLGADPQGEADRWHDAPLRPESAYSAGGEQDADARGARPGVAMVSDQEFKKGDICGEWRIEDFVAEGGMGEVYKARSVLGGLRGALKRMRPKLSAVAGMGKRFKTEIEILATLDCPYIVRPLHAGMHKGSPYLVMEWLEGMTLRDFLNQRREPIPLDKALHYAICIATALCDAHAADVLHRDLKPENVFMLEKGTLKVLDFGLGKWATSNRVSTSEALGGLCTVHYAAPEQLENTGVDDRTDVRALALIFMEVATLRYAFADRPGVLPPKEIARANQLLAEPPSLRVLLPDCPPSLVELIDAALRRDKSQRPHSADFLAALKAEREKLREATTAAQARIDDEDSVDEAGPAPAPAKPAHENSAVRVIRQIRTMPLDPGSPPGDPTAAGNPLPPAVKTIKMAVTPEPAERGGDVTSGGRSATLPPESRTPPAESATLPPESATLPREPGRTHAAFAPQVPDCSLAHAPTATTAAPLFGSEAPMLHGRDEAAARASLELANSPTLPWQPALPAPAATASLNPTDGGPSLVQTSRQHPAWVPLLLGATIVFVGFAGIKLVQTLGRHAHEEPSATPTASASVSATPVAAPTSSTEASATVTAPAAQATATVTAPTATVEASAPPDPTATPAEAPTATATEAPMPAATAATGTAPASRPAPPTSAARAQPPAPPPLKDEPAFVRRKPEPPPPAPSATQNPHRMFGSAE